MKDLLLGYLKAREEGIDLGGQKYLVRELQEDADRAGLQGAPEQEVIYKFLTRCVFYENGAPVFTDDDIASIRRSAVTRLAPLMQAVIRVNALSVEGEEKNSVAGPSSG